MTSFQGALVAFLGFATGAVASWIQERLKASGSDATIDQRLVALIMTMLAVLLAFGIQYGLDIVVFTDVSEPYDFVQIAMTVLMALGGNQAAYNFRVKKR